MTLNKIRLKSAFMMVYSISYWLFFAFLAFISIYAFISNAPNPKGAGFVVAMSVLAIVVIAIFTLISCLISFVPKRDSQHYGVVTGGLELLRRKYKFVSHSELGYYIFIFDGNDAGLYEVNWFSLKYILDIDLHNYKYDSEKISKRINSHLDDLYKVKLAEIRRAEDIKNGVDTLINKWDGYLDKVSRRDGKIDQLLK